MKKMNKKGFTLMEMLIVIAIIAILIAIAIPTFTAALEKSRQKTDLANARALKSLVVAQYMAGDESKPDIPVDVLSKFEGKGDSDEITFYLNKNGQELTETENEKMKVAAKWNNKYGTDAVISCTFNGTCKMTASEPKLDTAS